jgi:hypothetical protein
MHRSCHDLPSQQNPHRGSFLQYLQRAATQKHGFIMSRYCNTLHNVTPHRQRRARSKKLVASHYLTVSIFDMQIRQKSGG